MYEMYEGSSNIHITFGRVNTIKQCLNSHPFYWQTTLKDKNSDFKDDFNATLTVSPSR
jgi:hypothetical protein